MNNVKSVYVVVCNDVYNGQLTKVNGAYTSKARAEQVKNQETKEDKPTKQNDYAGEDLHYFIQKVALNK